MQSLTMLTPVGCSHLYSAKLTTTNRLALKVNQSSLSLQNKVRKGLWQTFRSYCFSKWSESESLDIYRSNVSLWHSTCVLQLNIVIYDLETCLLFPLQHCIYNQIPPLVLHKTTEKWTFLAMGTLLSRAIVFINLTYMSAEALCYFYRIYTD